ncbi:integrase, catalytic region, zinc finger, CCHC-type containing protein [Tanacetum coccineum]
MCMHHQEAAKDIWDRVKMLMKGTELSYQERECRLYNLFDKFAHVLGETLYENYWRFSQLINDMHTIGMTMQQVKVNTKFLNALPSEWSKFVIDVKLAKSLYTTNYDQLYAYLNQHERHANEVRINRERYPDSLAFIANSPTLYTSIHHQHHHTPVNPQQHSVSPAPFISPLMTPQSQAEFPQLDFGLVVPMFQQGEDPIECINKAMAFLSTIASRFPPLKNQLRTSSNPRNQATIQDGRVTVQQVQGRQIQSYAGIENKGIATTLKGNVANSPPRVVKCYNCQGEGHMARQCTQPKRPRNAAWFKEKLMLAEAQETGQILDEKQLAFLADPAKAVLMANLSSCDPEVLFVVPYSDSYPNDMINQYVQEMQCSEQTHVDDFEDNEIHSVEQMTDHVAHLDKENQTNKMVNESLTAELERYKEQITIFEQRLNVDLNQREKLIDSQMDDLIRDRNAKLAAFQQEIDTLKETLSNNFKEKESVALVEIASEHLSTASIGRCIHLPDIGDGSTFLAFLDAQLTSRVKVSIQRDVQTHEFRPAYPQSSNACSKAACKSLVQHEFKNSLKKTPHRVGFQLFPGEEDASDPDSGAYSAPSRDNCVEGEPCYSRVPGHQNINRSIGTTEVSEQPHILIPLGNKSSTCFFVMTLGVLGLLPVQNRLRPTSKAVSSSSVLLAQKSFVECEAEPSLYRRQSFVKFIVSNKKRFPDSARSFVVDSVRLHGG